MRLRFQKHRAKLKNELGHWQRRISGSPAPQQGSHTQSGLPVLVSVEPLVATHSAIRRPNQVEYRAQLRLTSDEREHEWQTEPFLFDDLLKVVVNTRVANATRWCSARSSGAQGWGETELTTPKGAAQPAVASERNCVHPQIQGRWFCSTPAWLRELISALPRLVGYIGLWSSLLAVTWATSKVLLPWVRAFASYAQVAGASDTYMKTDLAELLVACVLGALCVSFLAGLLAGVAELSFLPTKVILQLERKDETAKVEEQLQLLLNGPDCLRNLDVCNFLNLGMATFYGSSETQKEGRCFCRRHKSTEVYFTQARHRRCSFLCFSCDFRCRWRRVRRRGLKERWLVLRKDGLALFSSLMDEDPTDMLLFDTGFSLFRDDDNRILVCGSNWVLELDFGEPYGARRDVVQNWCNAITLTAQLSPRTREQRFGSYAPIRYPAQPKLGDRHHLRRSLARFLIGGRATYRKIAEAILLAEHEIFVLGWWISPHLRLVRDGDALPGGADPRLSALLRSAADRGVRVFVLVYANASAVLPNDSEWAEAELQHPNVFVVRHRSRWDINILWSHHEKAVVIDQQLAFLGGLDLCLGRYDDSHHRLYDPQSLLWPGQDYSNPRIRDFEEVRLDKDILDRNAQQRMPWHDIHCMLLGRPARDVARHCIERWNHAKSKRPQYSKMPTVILRRKVAVCNDALMPLTQEGQDEAWPREFGSWHECVSQVVRSVGPWSAGTRSESSAHTAYCDLLQEAERFVYIENQFFCSGMDGDETIGNRVVEALFRRVLRAHRQQENFHVMMLLPLLPALDGVVASIGSPLMYVIYWQYRTLRTLRQQLADAGVNMASYISVFGLRTHERLRPSGTASPAGNTQQAVDNTSADTGGTGQLASEAEAAAALVEAGGRPAATDEVEASSPKEIASGRTNVDVHSGQRSDDSASPSIESDFMTEEIYIHSKLMIVDDRSAIVGSANLNDRSLLGSRDSEVCVVLKDTNTSEVALGGPWQAGGFAWNLRRALFAQHLGWCQDEPTGDLADPLSAASLREIRDIARQNTQIYEEVFGALPTDSIRTWTELAARRSAIGQSAGDCTRLPAAGSGEALAKVRGHLVEYPIDFLADEDLAPSAFSVGGLTPDAFN